MTYISAYMTGNLYMYVYEDTHVCGSKDRSEINSVISATHLQLSPMQDKLGTPPELITL